MNRNRVAQAQQVERKLTAILAADVVGYSRLMGVDEAGTVARLKALRAEAVEPCIARRGGRTVKLMGDGALVAFASVVEAVACAVEIQQAIAAHQNEVAAGRRIAFRLGVNLGDVILDEGELYGDGINVAARLQTMAEAGGLCMSGMVHEQVRDKLPYPFEDIGEQQLKNLTRPVRVYALSPASIAALAQGGPAPRQSCNITHRPCPTRPRSPSLPSPI